MLTSSKSTSLEESADCPLRLGSPGCRPQKRALDSLSGMRLTLQPFLVGIRGAGLPRWVRPEFDSQSESVLRRVASSRRCGRFWYPRAQARMWAALIIMSYPLFKKCPQVSLVQRNQEIQTIPCLLCSNSLSRIVSTNFELKPVNYVQAVLPCGFDGCQARRINFEHQPPIVAA